MYGCAALDGCTMRWQQQLWAAECASDSCASTPCEGFADGLLPEHFMSCPGVLPCFCFLLMILQLSYPDPAAALAGALHP